MAKDVILAADLGGTQLTPDELAAIPDFSGIKKDIWSKFPGAIAKKEFQPGEIIFREGDSGTTAFYLMSGTVDVYLNRPAAVAEVSSPGGAGWFGKLRTYLTGVSAEQISREARPTHIQSEGSIPLPLTNPLATLDAGELFGELSALAAFKQEKVKRAKFYPRSATVQAKTPVTVLEMLPNILNNVLFNSAAFKDKLNKNFRIRALDTHMRSVAVFAGLTQEYLDYLRDRVDLVDFAPGQVIVRQGDPADAFYMIRLGFVKVSQEFPGGEMVFTYLSRGSYFGEIGLLPPVFRLRAKGVVAGQANETVVSGEPVLIGRNPTAAQDRPMMAVPWDEYISRDHLTIQSEGQKARVKRVTGGKNPIEYKDSASDSFLLSPGETFKVGTTTFTLLDDAYPPGKRMATCTAMDFCQLVKIKAEDFAKLRAEFPEVDTGIKEVARARRDMDAQFLNRVSAVSMNTFLDQELMQGQNLLLIDLDKCTRCDECAKACIATHGDGVPRLLRQGLRFDKYLVPTSCRACLDPLCMTRCPVGSIRRNRSLDIKIEDWCIGCGNCAIDCPYGNINVVKVHVPGDGLKAEPRPKAAVCDLCAQYEEPNCVRACPHDAAIRVEPKRFFARDLAGVQLYVEPPTAPQALEASALLSETRIHSNISMLLNLLPRVDVKSGLRAGETIQLNIPSTTIGRSAECNLIFEDDGVSRLHCIIVTERGRFFVRDQESTNGTLVNGNAVAEAELREGDLISIGDVDLVYLSGQVQ